MKSKILQQGAEALILLDGNNIIKRRTKKSYRISEIDDKIRKQRTRSEAKLLVKASEIISIPKVKRVDEKSKEIIMKFIKGKKLSEHLDSFPLKKQKEICRIIGGAVARIHDADIIHGDLTTSNMIFAEDKVFFIDFGLGFISHKVEDKAVDLHLLRQALEAKHFRNWESLFSEILKGYSGSKNYEIVLKQLRKVETRGRYKKSH